MRVWIALILVTSIHAMDIELCDHSNNDTLCNTSVNCNVVTDGECFPRENCDRSGLCWGRVTQINGMWVKSENYLSEECNISDFTILLPIDECFLVDIFGTEHRSLVTVSEAHSLREMLVIIWMGVIIAII